MPEGHKTHALAREHSARFAEQILKVTSPQGRFRGDARKVSGKVFERCEAVGKHLFYHFEGNRIIHVHLGRYGKFREHATPPPAPVGQVRMRIVGDTQAIDLNGPTTCRVIDDATRSEVVSKLGPDPLAGGKKRDVFENIRKSAKPIGALILDQAVVAGVGNIFRAELFFEIALDPNRPGNEITSQEFDALWKSLTKMMRTGLKYGKIITVTAKEAGKPLASLEGSKRFRIYGNESCPTCDTAIEALNLASRKLYWCPSCQSG
ncbi:MAG: DNA-formamidopyrimidine glycosylase family protein [Planctomycetota bacterium]